MSDGKPLSRSQRSNAARSAFNKRSNSVSARRAISRRACSRIARASRRRTFPTRAADRPSKTCAGHVTFTIESLTLLRPFVQDGRLRVLAVTTAQRAKSMPDVPTMAEAGVPGYELTGWVGIAAPAGTPRPVIDRLYAEIAKIAATAEAKAWFDSFSSDAGAEPPDAFAALVRAEYVQMGEVVRAMGLKAE
jgi:tripartite-type tricarboxylate transporter receptor subunit TctC